ncbi:hypothetical protein EXIGLDRAFT_636798 [Exidia glandulosa HHB12029]|uniref:Cyclase n=1 Tax=Exidia glandulosa HHB12029 TaxID=1314781 RepID=A0A165PX24_EXIGL|nr:hypothetical protein EXIGLDRAFT_636798 [Exidia glandulosa HHB12029]
MSSIPDFDSLPKVEGMPQGCAWGVFDKDGKKDLLGTLNLLTPDVVKAAASEVKEGVSISLNWPLNGMRFTFPGRNPPVHKVQNLESMGLKDVYSWDDEIEFNTQISSQWDSLCHFQHQPSGLAYNGFSLTKEDLSKDSTAENTAPTLDHWHERGGVVARGVLIDYKAYADEKGIAFGPFDGKSITVRDLEEVAKHQGVEFKQGDILIVRTGYTEALTGKTAEEQLAYLMSRTVSGVEPSEEVAKWVWNKHFAAVASDNVSFETIPLTIPDGSQWQVKDLVLHPWFLSMFGLHIGELWDLTALSAHCKKAKRYTFMLTSVPLNLPCLVGSPPNALAIF